MVDRVREGGRASSTLTRKAGWFYHHDGMCARKWPLLLCGCIHVWYLYLCTRIFLGTGWGSKHHCLVNCSWIIYQGNFYYDEDISALSSIYCIRHIFGWGGGELLLRKTPLRTVSVLKIHWQCFCWHLWNYKLILEILSETFFRTPLRRFWPCKSMRKAA